MPPAIPYPIMLYSAPMAWPAARKRKKKKKVILDFKGEGGLEKCVAGVEAGNMKTLNRY